MFKGVAQTLANEGYLTQEELTTVFEPIEKQIQSVNRIRDEIHKHDAEYYRDVHEGKPHESFWHMPHSLWSHKKK